MSNDKFKELNEKLRAEMAKLNEEIPETKITTEAIVPKKEAPMRKGRQEKGDQIIDTTRMTPDLQNWILDEQIKSANAGLDISPKKFIFQSVNGSETNKDYYGTWKTKIQGRIIRPVMTESGDITVEMKKAYVEVPIHSSLYHHFVTGVLEPVRMYAEDFATPQDKLSAYQICMLRVHKEEGKILLGNIRQGDPVLWIADMAGIKEVFGYNILKDDNPYKVIDLWRTTTKMVPMTEGTVRVRFVDKMSINGVARNDGPLFGRMQFYYHPLHKEHKTLLIKSCVQVRVSNKDLPKIKGNLYLNDYQYFSLNMELGFNPYEADIITAFDNVKNKDHGLKHGDIVEMSIEDLRIIGTASSKGKSSYGIQLLCMGAEVSKFQAILKEFGIEEKGQEILDAMTGKMSAVSKVLDSQRSDTSFEDQRELYMRCALFGIQRDGEWYIPMITKNVSALYVRLNSMLSNELMKLKVSSHSPYIMPWVELDHLEMKLHAEGQVVRFFCPPNNSKMRKLINSKKHVVLGANPVVAPFSIQTFIPIRENVLKTGVYTGDVVKDGPIVYNSSRDTIEISNQSAYMMIRDFDGDKVSVCCTNSEPPRTYRTVVMKDDEKGPKPEPPKNMAQAIRKLLAVSTSIAQAAQDTGSVDLASREVYVDRLNKATATGDPKWFLTLKQSFKLGWDREKKIQGQKWVSEQQEHDAAYDIKKTYGIYSPDLRREQSNEYKLVHRHAFLPMEKRSDRNIFNERLNLINLDINKNIPHWPGFAKLKGAKIVTRHSDSNIIRERMKKIFDAMVKHHVRHAAEKGWTFTIPEVQAYGKLLNDYFSMMSNAIMNEYYDTRNRKKRAEDFRLLGKCIRYTGITIAEDQPDKTVKNVTYPSLEQMRERFTEKEARVWERYLAAYICTISFGGSDVPYLNRFGDTVNPYSLGGGPIGYLSDDALVYCGSQFAPENPELIKARDKMKKLTKSDERAGRQEAHHEEDEEY